MLRSKEYVIDGSPITWKRARLSKMKRFYDGQTNEKVVYGLMLNKQHHGNLLHHGQKEPLFTKPLHIDLIFYFNKMKRRQVRPQLNHGVFPDIDNTIKFIFDAMVGVLIEDDRLITSLTAIKKYDMNPRTYMKITELE
jgi:Holliday junction resolvase RusA-like endonuclease